MVNHDRGGWPAIGVGAEADAATALRRLLDREEIRELIGRFAYCVDFQDWALFESVLGDPLRVDLSSVFGGPEGLKEQPRQAFIDSCTALFARLDGTQHVPLLDRLSVDGDMAEAISLLMAQHFKSDHPGGAVQRMLGHYRYGLTRKPDGWRITEITYLLRWNEGNWGVIAQATQA